MGFCTILLFLLNDVNNLTQYGKKNAVNAN